jgi:hypothetical protein
MEWTEEQYLSSRLREVRCRYAKKVVSNLPHYGVLKSPISSSIRFLIAKIHKVDTTTNIKESYLKDIQKEWIYYYENKCTPKYEEYKKRDARLFTHRLEMKYGTTKRWFSKKPVLVMKDSFIANEITLPLLVRDCQILFSLSNDELDDIARVYKRKYKINRYGWLINFEELKSRDYEKIATSKTLNDRCYLYGSVRFSYDRLSDIHGEILKLLEIQKAFK